MRNVSLKKNTILIAALSVACVLAVTDTQACPDVGDYGDELFYDSDDLWVERTHSVVAGGETEDSKCGIRTKGGDRVTGYFATAPDFELYYTKTEKFDLRLWVEGTCDTKLLVNTGAGNWFYDDDGGPGTDAQLLIASPSEGLYDIWVGTYDYDYCRSTLRLETFNP
jgi:hypothetical protein